MINWLGKKMALWIDRRTRLAKFAKRALNHVFPDHWSFMLGEIALYSFVILVITGTFLAMFYNSSSAQVIYHGSYKPLDGVRMGAAFESVLHISFDVTAGLLVRQMHHWAALIFVGAIVIHLARIFFTAAYRRPREINWVIGLTLLLFALVNGYFGYSIAGDLLSGAGLRIAYAILMSVPVVGQWLAFLILGGTVPVPATIPRFYSLHIFLVPATIAVFLALHLAIIWRQYHTNYPGPRRTDKTIVGSRLWPSYAFKSVGLFFLLFGVLAMLGGLVQIDPVWVYGPFDPIAILPSAQPDWYLGWIEGAMRLFPGVHLQVGRWLIPEIFFPAVLMPALLFLALYLYPFVEQLFTFDTEQHHVLRQPSQQPFNTALGCGVFMYLLVLFFAGGDDVIALATGTSVVTIRAILRVLVFAAPAVTFALVYLLCARARRHSASNPN
ncbi:MAG: cytochrome bc complex cytochrome b subunit [Candidatus Sulfotelmatobacter sp.]